MKTIKSILVSFVFMAFGTLMYAQGGCNNWKYYYADIANTGETVVYDVNLNGNFADLDTVVVSSDEVHIAFSELTKVLYLVRKLDGAVSIVDPQALSPTMGLWNPLSRDIPGIVTATIDPHGDLIIGSESRDSLYIVNLSTFNVATYDNYSPIRGGDIEFDSAGNLYLATGRELFLNQIDPIVDIQIGILDNTYLSTGLALMNNDDLISSYRGLNKLKTHTVAAVAGPTYDLRLGGNSFSANYGDLTSGCIPNPPSIDSCKVYSTFYVNHGPGIQGSDLYRITFNGTNAVLTKLTNVGFEAHIGYDGVHNIIYFVAKDGSKMVEYDVIYDFLHTPVLINPGLSQITAVVYDEKSKDLFVGSGNQDKIFRLTTLGTHSFYANAPISGGDLAIKKGVIYIASRDGNKLHSLAGTVLTTLPGTFPSDVTGLANIDSPTGLIMSHYGATEFIEIDETTGNPTGITYPALFEGSSFTLLNGDMASGCTAGEILVECPNFRYLYIADNTPGIPQGNVYTGAVSGTNFVLTYFFNAGMSGHIAVSETNGEIYVIEDKGTNIKTFNSAGNWVRTTPLSGLNHTTTLVWHKDDGLLYTGDQTLDEVYIIDPVSGTKILFASNISVSGGDLVSTNHELHLVKRGGTTSQVYDITSMIPNYLFDAAKSINGAARMNPSGYIMSEGGNSVNFHTYDNTGAPGPVLNSVDAALNPFPLFDGDMASGCSIPMKPAYHEQVRTTKAGSLDVFPNPSIGELTVLFTTSKTGLATVEVYDMNGRQITTVFNSEAKEGELNTRRFNGSSLPNGIYMMVLKNKDEIIKAKFVIAR